MGKRINIRPTSGVYATYKRLSYQPWTAIAEFVDNSTQSFYDHKEELLSLKYSKGLKITIDYISDANKGDRIEIYDDAYGMEWDDFQRAIILDRPPSNTNGRNEFGMGLKTAACWFGSVWSVESTRLNSKNKYYTEINIDELGKYKTEEIDVREEDTSPKEHYTKIVIRNLNKKISGSRTIAKVKDLLSSIYREDIRSGYIKIYYNGTLLQFKEAPIYVEDVNGEKKTWKKEVKFTINHENKELPVYGFIAIRIPGSVKDAGLTLLRRGRVIIGGSESTYRPTELFGDSNSYAWQRLYGELHMDNWPVTQAKDNFDWHNSSLEELFINTLEPIIREYRKKAENIRVREKINSNDLVQSAVNGLADSGLLENVDIIIEERATQAGGVSQSLSNVKSTETSKEGISGIATDTAITSNDDTDGVIIEGGDLVHYKFKYKETEYLFNIVFDISNPALDWLLVEPIDEYEYTISINMKHSFFKPLIEKREFLPIMTRMSIALVLAEIESLSLSHDGRIEPSDIRLKMNEILENVRRGGSNE